MDTDWWQTPPLLWERPLEFWPTPDQTPPERTNSLVRLIIYSSALSALLTRSPSWLLYGATAAVVLTLAAAARNPPALPCMEPTPTNFSMNPQRYTVPGAGWQAGRIPACKYDTAGRLAAKVVAARKAGLPEGSDVTPYYTRPGAASLDPHGDWLKLAYGDWHRPTCKQDQMAC